MIGPEDAFVPAHVRGWLTSGGSELRLVALVLNGVVAAIASAEREAGGTPFEAFLPEAYRDSGEHQLEVCSIRIEKARISRQ